MSNVDWMGYAQYMGRRNPVADSLNQLGNTIDQGNEMEINRQRQDRQNRLADIQIQQAQIAIDDARRKQADQEQLRSTLSSLQPTVTPAQQSPEQLAAYTPEALDLAQGKLAPMVQDFGVGEAGSMVPNPAYERAQGQLSLANAAPAIPEQVTPADPIKAIFDHAMKTGSLDTAKNAIDMQKFINDNSPDKLKAAESQKELVSFTSALKHMKELKQAGVLTQGLLDGMMGMMPDNIKAKFPNGIKLNEINGDGGLDVKDAQGNIIARWAVSPDGSKTELIKATADTKGFDTIDMGDKVKIVPRDGSPAYYEKKGMTPGAAARITINQTGKEKDLPTGIQDKIGTKLEIYNDWSTLKDKFKPEYMPGSPVKSINELQINLNKIFGKNQAAVDWWTQYFDARNIILKERSGAAVMEPEFKRFEQGTIAANSNPQSVINYLDRSVTKYKQHVDGILDANRRNHPESVKSYEEAYGYQRGKGKGTSQAKPARTSGRFSVVEVP